MEVQKKQAPKWVPGKFIGRGCYGEVSVGVRQSDGCRFAVKSARKDSFASVEALENEIMILSSLSSSSPFIVEYYGHDETASERNLHMEYLPGGDVAKAGAVGDVELIRSYAWCLVKALKEVHSKGIVHCDVKGSNVLLGPTTGVVKLSDFGSSKFLIEDDQRPGIVPRGSPLWMAPEVVRGESQGCESDVWSLGCTVIEMFTGVPAWKDCGAHTLRQIGYSDELPEYPAQLPELAKDFLGKCLNRDAGQRWSCDQLLQHPFLLSVPLSKIIESSPRSIFDWQDLNFSDEDEDEDDETPSTSFQYNQLDDIPAKDRIGELATTSGVNWESDGWVEVRSLTNKKQEQEKQSVAEGTSWEYADVCEGKDVNSQELNREIYSDDYATWINLSTDDIDNDENNVIGGDGVGRCGHGDSCGGENSIEKNNHNNNNNQNDIETHVKVDFLLLFFSSLLLLHVLNTNIHFNKRERNQCYIVLQFLVSFILLIGLVFDLQIWTSGGASSSNLIILLPIKRLLSWLKLVY